MVRIFSGKKVQTYAIAQHNLSEDLDADGHRQVWKERFTSEFMSPLGDIRTL